MADESKEYPSNSRTGKNRRKLEQVADGSLKSENFVTKLKSSFFEGDSRTVGSYVFWEVIIPELRSLILEAGTRGLEHVFRGDSRGSSPYHRPVGLGVPQQQTPYGSIYNTRALARPTRPPLPAKVSTDNPNVVLSTKDEAEEILRQLSGVIDEYGVTTVSDLYDLIGREPTFIDDGWGWSNLSATKIVEKRGGWVLMLPPTIKLEG